MMELFVCRPEEIDRAWADGAHRLSEATKWAAREVTADQLKMLLSRGERTLIGARENGVVKGWAAVGIQQLPNIRVLYVYAIQGSGIFSVEGLGLLKTYAQSLGCSTIRGSVRASMARLLQKLGGKPLYQTYEMEAV